MVKLGMKFKGFSKQTNNEQKYFTHKTIMMGAREEKSQTKGRRNEWGFTTTHQATKATKLLHLTVSTHQNYWSYGEDSLLQAI